MQPTTPLVSSEDIDNAIEIHTACNLSGYHLSTISVCEAPVKPEWLFSSIEGGLRYNPSQEPPRSPFYAWIKPAGKDALEKDRQFLKKWYIPNGAIYINDGETLFGKKTLFGEKIVGYIMPRERSVDIDDELDLVITEAIFRYNMKKISKGDRDYDTT